MDKKELRVATYARVATEEQLKNMNEEEQKSVTENEMKSHLALLQIYQLEDNFKNKLSRLDNNIADNKVKAVIYTNDEEYFDGKSKKLNKIKKFCKKQKINIEKEYLDSSLVNNYKKKDLNNLIIDAISRKFNTVVLLNSKDMGESTLINTHIINEIFTRNGIRFIDIEQKVDTNLDGTLVMYENIPYQQLMNFIDTEERKMRSEKIKIGKEAKKREKIK
ncbi:MAG: recombinase family protein [Clostridia bacterium]|nr:recombinase family protein [Clostridia bacterium]